LKHYLQRASFFFRYAWLFSMFVNLTILSAQLQPLTDAM
jgi:hypothetical protein